MDFRKKHIGLRARRVTRHCVVEVDRARSSRLCMNELSQSERTVHVSSIFSTTKDKILAAIASLHCSDVCTSYCTVKCCGWSRNLLIAATSRTIKSRYVNSPRVNHFIDRLFLIDAGQLHDCASSGNSARRSSP